MFFKVGLFLIHVLCFSQDDLLDILDKETVTNDKDNIVTSTFKGTRILNGHFVENRKAKQLEFIILGRNTGIC